jgi:hypothetical protein
MGMVQISMLVGCAGVAIRCVTQLLLVFWSLRTDEKGRRHAVEILKALRWDGFKQRLPGEAVPSLPPREGPPCKGVAVGSSAGLCVFDLYVAADAG